jgi:ParB family transcriptional regulator, chromosome partitioning protein
MTLSGEIDDVEISNISSSSYQLHNVNLDSIDSLCKSISDVGLLQPIVVRIRNDSESYEIIAGSRRFYACKKLGWKKIPCIIVDVDDKFAFEIAIIENIQRKDLTFLEEARAFKDYVYKYGWGGISNLSSKIGKSVSYITKRIKLLELPADIIKAISDSSISICSAEELLFIPYSDQLKLANKISAKSMTVKEVRKMASCSKDQSIENDPYPSSTAACYSYELLDKRKRIYDKSILVLRLAMKKLIFIIEHTTDDKDTYNILMKHKSMLHDQIDQLLKNKKMSDFNL